MLTRRSLLDAVVFGFIAGVVLGVLVELAVYVSDR